MRQRYRKGPVTSVDYFLALYDCEHLVKGISSIEVNIIHRGEKSRLKTEYRKHLSIWRFKRHLNKEQIGFRNAIRKARKTMRVLND